MFRNREIRHYLGWLLFLSLLFIVVGFFYSPFSGFLLTCCSLSFVLVLMLFSRWRYRQLSKLSDYLKRINGGDFALDVRDNTEGELSILKSEIYKVTVTLKRQNEALRQDKVALQNALSDVSHQLKTPLTSLFVMTDLLMDMELPMEKRAEFTDRIRAQLERLQWLVASLLKLSRLDAKTVEFKPQPILAQHLLEKACAPLLIPMEVKNHSFHVTGQDRMITCDANWTVEAVLNILKNCVEHTPEGGTIAVSFSENPLFSEILIQDSGSGIDDADLPHIFERFYRGKNASFDSVGIGLAMAATIVQEQGGSIDAKNKSGAGCLFTIRFPK